MMLIICKLYVWIHITWEAYVTFSVYWNKWLLIAPPECSLHDSQQMEAPLKIKTMSSGELRERLNIIQCHWSNPLPLKYGSSWYLLLHTCCSVDMASLKQSLVSLCPQTGNGWHSWGVQHLNISFQICASIVWLHPQPPRWGRSLRQDQRN